MARKTIAPTEVNMRIILINWTYPNGSTGYIVRDTQRVLTRLGHQVKVACGVLEQGGEDGAFLFCKPWERRLFRRLNRIGWPKFHGSSLAAKRLTRYIGQESPDVVHLHLAHCNCVNMYYVLKYLGKHNIKTVVTNHAELYYTGSCGHAYDCMRWVTDECRGCPNKVEATSALYFGRPHLLWKLMRKSFSHFNSNYLLFTAVSPWVKSRFLQSPIVKGFDCEVVMNGLDTEVFRPKNSKVKICERINSESYILHVTATFNPASQNDVKGAYHLAKLAESMPEQKFVVVATSVVNADNLPNNIFLWGRAKDQEELAELYSSAEVTVIVSRRETFSMVTAESLCCGTPVVGFKAGGPESIAIREYSSFVEYGDIESLNKALTIMTKETFDRKDISYLAREKYSKETMSKGYFSVYEKLLTR